LADYYKILHIGHDAGLDDVKKAYRKLAYEYHPDVSQMPDARERFIELNEAYVYLLNKIKLELELKRYKSMAYEETAQGIIDTWIATERERIRSRAGRHANMRFRNFKKTKVYRTTEILNNSLNIGTLLLGIFVFFGPVFGTWRQWIINPKMIDLTYIISSLIVVMVGILMTSYSVYKIIQVIKENRRW